LKAASDGVFLDASGLLALLSARDKLHSAAADALAEIHSSGVQAICTDWVLTEVLAGASARSTRRRAATFVRNLMAQPKVVIEPATRVGWLASLALYGRRVDKEWSLVDCSSILTCHEHGITRVFTADHHFAQAGLEILL
jgi:uncharacterized protein